VNEREEAINALIKNARHVSTSKKSEVLSWQNIVTSDDGEGDGYIPGYIPYIGKNFFSKKLEGTRIIIYALSQNLKGTGTAEKEWAKSWNRPDKDDKVALDRQNYSYEKKGKSIMMHPFDTGHLPVVSAILLKQLGKDPRSLGSIYDVVAATNLSKYSFRNASGRTMDSNESLNKCLDWFSKYEIEILKPNYIICAGNVVWRILNKFEGVKIVKVAFPSLQVINRWHKEYGGYKKYKHDTFLSMISENDLKKDVFYTGKVLRDVIKRDVVYFSNMYSEIGKQLNCN
jgi:hypothetical protein